MMFLLFCGVFAGAGLIYTLTGAAIDYFEERRR